MGEGLMMVSYGYSGAGKTTTLCLGFATSCTSCAVDRRHPRIGDATAPVGGGTGIDGVLSLYLKENSPKIEETWQI